MGTRKVTTFIIVVGTLLALATTTLYLYRAHERTKKELSRQLRNVEVLNANYKTYKTAYGNSVMKVQQLNYTVKELKAYETELIERLKQASIKPKHVKSVVQVGTEIVIRDTVPIYITDTLRCFTYNDGWNLIAGCLTYDDRVQLEAVIKDHLDIVPTIIPKKFLFFNVGVKAVEVNVISQNPLSEYTYGKYIEIKRK